MNIFNPKEFKLMALRDCPTPKEMQLCETPEQAANYWRLHVQVHPYFDPDRECLIVLLLTTRRHIKGHHLVSIGTMDTILVSPVSIFRVAVVASAAAAVLMHNHPSGDATPSEADVRVTRELVKAGQLLRIELLDHVIVGASCHVSLRELGYLTSP